MDRSRAARVVVRPEALVDLVLRDRPAARRQVQHHHALAGGRRVPGHGLHPGGRGGLHAGLHLGPGPWLPPADRRGAASRSPRSSASSPTAAARSTPPLRSTPTPQRRSRTRAWASLRAGAWRFTSWSRSRSPSDVRTCGHLSGQAAAVSVVGSGGLGGGSGSGGHRSILDRTGRLEVPLPGHPRRGLQMPSTVVHFRRTWVQLLLMTAARPVLPGGRRRSGRSSPFRNGGAVSPVRRPPRYGKAGDRRAVRAVSRRGRRCPRGCPPCAP
jgi:hypothetical protein